MLAFRLFILAMIIVTSSIIGILFSKKYANREKEIKEMKNALNMFATKIKFTYEPLKEIFKQISKDNQSNVERIFGQMANQITYFQTREVWENCIQEADISINQEDKDILIRKEKWIEKYIQNNLNLHLL